MRTLTITLYRLTDLTSGSVHVATIPQAELIAADLEAKGHAYYMESLAPLKGGAR